MSKKCLDCGKWLVCIDTLHNVSIHLVQKPWVYRYNKHFIDSMNHCINTRWYVSIHFFTECMFWSWHGLVSIHGSCIDTEAHVSIHLHVLSIQIGTFQIFGMLEHCIDTWEPCIDTFEKNYKFSHIFYP